MKSGDIETLRYAPLGKWGPLYVGKARVTAVDADGVDFEVIGDLDRIPAPLWRTILYHLWVKWYWRFKHDTT